MKVQIAKFELYPMEDAIGYATGFKITANNNRFFYRDIIVLFEESQGKTDMEILSLGWEKLRVEIENEVAKLEAKSTLLGKEWIPYAEDIIDVTPVEDVTPTEQ